jgi:hypothetical protein
MARVYIMIILTLLGVKEISAQANNNYAPNFVFDPTFWKSELRLSRQQCEEIRNINSEFYSSLLSISQGNSAFVSEKAASLLRDREIKIWNAFSARQRKKWQKLESFYCQQGHRKSTLPKLFYSRNSAFLADGNLSVIRDIRI